jgi:hypothetical protein
VHNQLVLPISQSNRIPLSSSKAVVDLILSMNNIKQERKNLRNDCVECNASRIGIQGMTPFRVSHTTIQQLNALQVGILRPLGKVPFRVVDVDLKRTEYMKAKMQQSIKLV